MTASGANTPHAAHGGPLAGLRVLDLASVLAGPFATRILADLGAEVIKIESAGSDPNRLMGAEHDGLTAGFELFNHGKKSYCVDLKNPDDLARVHQLVETADIFLHNSRPGVMERLGLGWDQLRAINPRLIYGIISGFGETGPYAGRPCYDGLVQGLTGFMPVQGGEDGPKAVLNSLADKVTAMWMANSLTAALLHRANTGEGQKIVVSILRAYSAFINYDLMLGYTFGALGFQTIPSPAVPTYKLLNTADGQVIGLVLQKHQFEGLCRGLGREDLIDDPRFAGAGLRAQNLGLLYDALADQTSKLTTEAFLTLAVEHGAPFAPVNSIEDFFEDPQVQATACYVEFDDPEVGRVRHLNYPADFERSPADVRSRSPRLGEHNEEINAELRRRTKS